MCDVERAFCSSEWDATARDYYAAWWLDRRSWQSRGMKNYRAQTRQILTEIFPYFRFQLTLKAEKKFCANLPVLRSPTGEFSAYTLKVSSAVETEYNLGTDLFQAQNWQILTEFLYINNFSWLWKKKRFCANPPVLRSPTGEFSAYTLKVSNTVETEYKLGAEF